MNTVIVESECEPGSSGTNTQTARGLPPLPNDARNNPNFEYLPVAEIKPEMAIELLCIAIDALKTISTADRLRPEAGDASALGTRCESASGENTSAPLSVLHFRATGRDLMQESLLSNKFLSKREPPIPLREYLVRFHHYCPLSTGVYLTAGLYITRIAKVERVMTVNRMNLHRLVLAGLRVAMKMVEDVVYSHNRVAKVGGVTERELTRLEISFCFLASFNLRFDKHMLQEQARVSQWQMKHPTEPRLEA